ncbi:hypothetical protein BH20ACT10_BH20ACT10_22270 [soil metagenome]
MYVGSGIFQLFAPQESPFTSSSDYVIEATFVLGLAGTLAAIAGLHFLQRERYGWLGTAGSVTAFAGHALLLAIAATTTLAGRETFDALFPAGVLAAFVGLVLMGVASLRARILPWMYGALLIFGFPLSMVLSAANLGSVALGAVWMLVGYALWTRREDAPRPRPAVT